MKKDGESGRKSCLDSTYGLAISQLRTRIREKRKEVLYYSWEKKGWKTGKCVLCAEKGEGWIIELEVKKEDLTIISVYGEQGGKNLIKDLGTCVEAKEMENVIIEGDFNIKIGNLCRRGAEKKEIDRSSKDKCISNRGKEVYGIWIREKTWEVLNGYTEGDWEGEFTYVGARESTVICISYILVNENICNKIDLK